MGKIAELEEQIAQKNEEISGLREDIKRLEKYKQYDESAEEIKAVHDSFVNQGFTDQQAFEMTKNVISGAMIGSEIQKLFGRI